jgi:putative membrane protein
MIESIGGLMALRQWLRLSRAGRLPARKPFARRAR